MSRSAKPKQQPKRKPGRPPLPGGERVPVGLRVTLDIRKGLDDACKASGRSLSQEAEFRLEQTFNRQNAVFDALDLAYGRRWTGILLAISTLAQITGTRAIMHSGWKFDAGEQWDRDPYAYEQVVQAINFLLEAFRPKGGTEPPAQIASLGLPASAYERMGEEFAKDLIKGLSQPAEKGPAWPFAYTAQPIRERIGDLLAAASSKRN